MAKAHAYQAALCSGGKRSDNLISDGEPLVRWGAAPTPAALHELNAGGRAGMRGHGTGFIGKALQALPLWVQRPDACCLVFRLPISMSCSQAASCR